MLRNISLIWWPHIHRDIVNTARGCERCLESGKNLKTLLKQKEGGKIPKSNEPNEKIDLDFAGPFQNSNYGKKYILVSIDNFSAWLEAKFLAKPSTKKVVEFLKNYVAQNGVPKQIRSDLGTVFMSKSFKQF